MYQVDWWNTIEPDDLLHVIRNHAGQRELRLFGCACARRIWDKFADAEQARAAVEIAESYVDGEASAADLKFAEEAADQAIMKVEIKNVEMKNSRRAAHGCVAAEMKAMGELRSIGWFAAFSYKHPSEDEERRSPEVLRERGAQLHLLRDIFLEPSVKLESNQGVLTDPTLRLLAQDIYENRILPVGNFEHAMIVKLRDRLTALNCTEPAVLTHLESPHPHVRGCWVVDLILGKRSSS